MTSKRKFLIIAKTQTAQRGEICVTYWLKSILGKVLYILQITAPVAEISVNQIEFRERAHRLCFQVDFHSEHKKVMSSLAIISYENFKWIDTYNIHTGKYVPYNSNSEEHDFIQARGNIFTLLSSWHNLHEWNFVNNYDPAVLLF